MHNFNFSQFCSINQLYGDVIIVSKILEVGFGGSSGSFRTAPDSRSGFWWIFRIDQIGFDNALDHPEDPLPEQGAVLNNPEDPPKPTSRTVCRANMKNNTAFGQ